MVLEQRGVVLVHPGECETQRPALIHALRWVREGFTEPAPDTSHEMLSPGALLIEVSGGGDQQPVGRVVKFDYEIEAVCSNFIARVVPKSGYEIDFLVYLHATLYTIGLSTRSIKQTTGIQNLGIRAYLNESVAFPPPPRTNRHRGVPRRADGQD